MSLNRFAKRRDKVEDELIEAAEKFGAWWVPFGPLDGWICHRLSWTPVEIKSPKGKYTPAQLSFLAYCKHYRAPVWTWRSTEDVRASLGAEALAP